MIEVGDRVRINHECVEDYWDITGTVIEIISKKIDSLNIRVEFDVPLGTLKDEYFSEKELDKLCAT